MPFVRRELGKRLRLRRIPELNVRLDDTAERGTRVLQLITELEAGATPDAAADDGESLPDADAAAAPRGRRCRRRAAPADRHPSDDASSRRRGRRTAAR